MTLPIPRKLQQINIHLIKQSITDFKDALAEGKSSKRLSADATLRGAVLYYDIPRAKPAGWRDFLAPGFGADLPIFNSQHASAVLFFKAAKGKRKRTFAVTFGYGRALLSEAALESDFGLRTALNLCAPDTLRAVNYRTIEERTRIGRVQLSDAGSVDAFRMNVDTDLLRGLEAESANKRICERLGARWSNLIVAARVGFGDLPTLAANLLTLYRKRKLPAEYQWIDNVRRVNDPSLSMTLDSELECRVASNQLNDIRLAMPEISGSTVDVVARLFDAKLDAEDFASDFAVYLNKRKQGGQWSVKTAKNSHKVFLLNSRTGTERGRVSVYRCIVAELELATERYLLVDGEWFQLDAGFVNEINVAMAKIPVLPHSFPAWKSMEAEEKWNKRACNSWGDAALLDKANIPHGGGRSKIEPADILTNGQLFCHAKRRDKSSQGLSHLFAQGVVAARLISLDDEFRQKVADVIPLGHGGVATKLRGAFDPQSWTIAYIILGADPSDPAGSIPFFSKVNLRGAIEQLRLMNYQVGIIGV